jgi:hypothetical protein
MTITHTGQAAQVSGSPTDLDLRRQLREAREEARALRAQAEALGSELTEVEHRYVEMHIAYVELLAHARAAVAAAARGQQVQVGYIAGHLQRVGLAPPAGAVADRVMAEGLATARRLAGGGA